MSHSGTDAKTLSWDVEEIRERANKVHDDSIVNNISRCKRCMGPIWKQCDESKFLDIPFSNKQNRIKKCRRKVMQKKKPPSDHFDCNICGEAVYDIFNIDEHMVNCEERAEIDRERMDDRMLSERKETRHRPHRRYVHTKFQHPDDRY